MSLTALETTYCDMIAATIRNKKNGTIKRFTRTPIETAVLMQKCFTNIHKHTLYVCL